MNSIPLSTDESRIFDEGKIRETYDQLKKPKKCSRTECSRENPRHLDNINYSSNQKKAEGSSQHATQPFPLKKEEDPNPNTGAHAAEMLLINVLGSN